MGDRISRIFCIFHIGQCICIGHQRFCVLLATNKQHQLAIHEEQAYGVYFHEVMEEQSKNSNGHLVWLCCEACERFQQVTATLIYTNFNKLNNQKMKFVKILKIINKFGKQNFMEEHQQNQITYGSCFLHLGVLVAYYAS